MIDYAVPTGLSPEELEKAIEQEKKVCDALTEWPEVD